MGSSGSSTYGYGNDNTTNNKNGINNNSGSSTFNNDFTNQHSSTDYGYQNIKNTSL